MCPRTGAKGIRCPLAALYSLPLAWAARGWENSCQKAIMSSPLLWAESEQKCVKKGPNLATPAQATRNNVNVSKVWMWHSCQSCSRCINQQITLLWKWGRGKMCLSGTLCQISSKTISAAFYLEVVTEENGHDYPLHQGWPSCGTGSLCVWHVADGQGTGNRLGRVRDQSSTCGAGVQHGA